MAVINLLFYLEKCTDFGANFNFKHGSDDELYFFQLTFVVPGYCNLFSKFLRVNHQQRTLSGASPVKRCLLSHPEMVFTLTTPNPTCHSWRKNWWPEKMKDLLLSLLQTFTENQGINHLWKTLAKDYKAFAALGPISESRALNWNSPSGGISRE